MLDLKYSIYQSTAVYSNFDREESEFTWERMDKA